MGSAEHGTDASRQVLGRGSFYTLGTAAPVLTQLAVTPAVTRILGPGPYGIVATAIVIIQVTMMVASLGIPSVITRHALMEGSGLPGARALFVRGSLLTAVLVVVAVAAEPLWGLGVEQDARLPWALALAGGGFFVLVESAQAMLRAEDRPLPFVTLSMTGAFGGPLLGLLLLWLVDATPTFYVLGLALGYAAAGAAGIWVCLARQPRRGAPGDLNRALRLGLPVLPHLVALFLASGALVFIAMRLWGRADSGRLQLALFIGSSPAVVTAALNNSWAPVIYRVPREERGRVLATTARDLAGLAALLCGGVCLTSPWLLRFVVDSRYSPDVLVLPVAIASVGALMSIAYLANVHLVFSEGRSLGLALTTPLSLLVGLTVALTLGRSHLNWIAAGFPATYIALAVLTGVLRRRVGGPAWNEGVLAAPFAGGLVLIALGGLLPITTAGLIVRLVLATVAGLVLLRLLRRVLRPTPAST